MRAAGIVSESGGIGVKYVVESEDQRVVVVTLSEAKLIAGEWQIERDRLVTIEWLEKPGQKFTAHLRLNDDTEHIVILEAQWNPIAPSSQPGQLQYAIDVEYVDAELERARRIAIYSTQMQPTHRKGNATGGSESRSVKHLATGRMFNSLKDAARWAGIDKNALRRRAKADNGWSYVEMKRGGRIASTDILPCGGIDVQVGSEAGSALAENAGARADIRTSLPSDTAMAV